MSLRAHRGSPMSMTNIQFIIGFTGTRKGCTAVQRAVLTDIVRTLSLGEDAIGLHGDCVGADAEFDEVCSALGVPTTCRPSNVRGARAKTTATAIAAPEAPLVRNRRIVDEADVMVAVTGGPEKLRSGTWSTVRYAKKSRKKIYVVHPDGTVTLFSYAHA